MLFSLFVSSTIDVFFNIFGVYSYVLAASTIFDIYNTVTGLAEPLSIADTQGYPLGRSIKPRCAYIL